MLSYKLRCRYILYNYRKKHNFYLNTKMYRCFLSPHSQTYTLHSRHLYEYSYHISFSVLKIVFSSIFGMRLHGASQVEKERHYSLSVFFERYVLHYRHLLIRYYTTSAYKCQSRRYVFVMLHNLRKRLLYMLMPKKSKNPRL